MIEELIVVSGHEIYFLIECPQYNKIRSKYKINDINSNNLDENFTKMLNPIYEKELKSICMYIEEALDLRDHRTVSSGNNLYSSSCIYIYIYILYCVF